MLTTECWLHVEETGSDTHAHTRTRVHHTHTHTCDLKDMPLLRLDDGLPETEPRHLLLEVGDEVMVDDTEHTREAVHHIGWDLQVTQLCMITSTSPPTQNFISGYARPIARLISN
jgi:hypothetical protein